MELKLKPCPFCGGKAEFSYYGALGVSVYCTGCHATVDDANYKEGAADHWNRRVVDTRTVLAAANALEETDGLHLPIEPGLLSDIADTIRKACGEVAA